MTSAATLVPIRSRRRPIRVTSLQDLFDAGEMVTTPSLSGESQTLGPKPWNRKGREDGGAKRSIMVSL